MVLASFIGGVVWEDQNADGIRNTSEPRVAGVTVYLVDSGGTTRATTATDSQGSYRFELPAATAYKLRFVVPTGYHLTGQDQGTDDTLDSDANPLTGETIFIGPPYQGIDATRWSAGIVAPCSGPDQPVYIYTVRPDVNRRPILNIQDPNQPSRVTGYNIYRSSSPRAPWPWPLLGSNVQDSDPATPNLQWVDQSGNPGTWFYQVTAYNATCQSEGPR